DLSIVTQLAHLAARQLCRGIRGEAHHQRRADREIGRDEERNPPFPREPVELPELFLAEPARADDVRDTLLEARANGRVGDIRPREVDRRVDPPELARIVPADALHVVPRGLERGLQNTSDLALVSEQRDSHAAARAGSSGLIRRRASRKRSSPGPMPAAESRSGASRTPASSATASAVTASISAAMRSIESSSVSVISDFPSRLIRFDVASIESRMRPFRFSFARSSSPLRSLPSAISLICSLAISRQSARFSARVPT